MEKNKVNPDTIDTLNRMVASVYEMTKEKPVVDAVEMSWNDYWIVNKDRILQEQLQMSKRIANRMVDQERDPVKKIIISTILCP